MMANPLRPFLLKRTSLLSLIGCVLFFVGNNTFSITDPDEAFYCLTAHEMAAHREWLTPLIFGHPQFEKPPLTYWLLEAAFNAWGESPFTARFFPALFAVMGVIAVYFLGLMVFQEERKAFLSALVLATAAFYTVMGKMVFTDMVFTVMILCAMTMWMWGYTDRRRQGTGWIGFYVFCSFSVLAKGPLGFLILHLTVLLFLLYRRQLNVLKSWWVPLGVVLCLAISLPWYAAIFQRYGHAFTHEFFYNDHWRRLISAEHKGNDHWFFYPAIMVGGMFPWSLFLAAAAVDLFKRLKSSVTVVDYLSLSWIAAVLLVFQFAHSKLTSYILPLFPAMALMTGNFLGQSLNQIQHHRRMQSLLSATFIALAVLALAVVAAHKAFGHYISSLWPVYFLSGALVALAGIGIALTLKEYLEPGLYVLAAALCPIFLTAFLVRTDIEGYVSSHEASAYLPSAAVAPTTVLTSKNNARGIRYFTGEAVAVVDSTAHPFFSPHPIAILDTTNKLMGVLHSQRVTFGVVRKGAYKEILKNSGPQHYHVSLLRVIGYDYVIRIDPLKHL